MNFHDWMTDQGYTELAQKACPDGRMKPMWCWVAHAQRQGCSDKQIRQIQELWHYWRANLIGVNNG